jgi:hypothetical protein
MPQGRYKPEVGERGDMFAGGRNPSVWIAVAAHLPRAEGARRGGGVLVTVTKRLKKLLHEIRAEILRAIPEPACRGSSALEPAQRRPGPRAKP